MSNNLVMFEAQGQALSKKFQPLVQAGIGNDLGDGIKGSYAIVSIKGSKFRIKYKGQETILQTADANGVSTPVSYIDVVIVKANGFLNKQYFEGKYQEGSVAPPVCYSLDGVKPSDSSTKKQATSCALCPKNQFGSLIGENGVKQKACRDTKKLAIVPAVDIRNPTLGGAMLFRVPPSSLKDLSAMADALKGRGYPYNSVVVRISFDLTASHPKPLFKAVRALEDNEADAVLEMFESDSVLRVLADNDVAVEHPDAVSQPDPVQPAAAQPRTVMSQMPSEDERQPVPQQKPQLFGMPGNDPPVQVAGGGTIQPKAAPMPTVEVVSPRVLRVKADDAPETAAPAQPAANPFAAAASPATAAPKPSAAPSSAAANPFAPPPGVAAPRQPAVIESTATEVPADNSSFNADIDKLLRELG